MGHLQRSQTRNKIANLTPQEVQRLDLKFAPEATTYHPENALFFGAAAGAAYYTGKKDTHWFPKTFIETAPHFEKIVILPKNRRDTEGFVLTSPHAIVVSLCGTNSGLDWLTNFNMALDLKANGLVHRGFWRALDIVWPTIEQTITEARKNSPNKPLWFCGHSLGGALSIVAALRSRHAGIPVSGVYTFGQPLVGEGQLNQALNETEQRIFRIVNDGDVVPLIPFTTTKPLAKPKYVRFPNGARRRITREPANFAEIGQYFAFDDHGDLHFHQQAPQRDETAARNAIEAIKSLTKHTLAIKNHDIERYLEGLERWRDKPPIGL